MRTITVHDWFYACTREERAAMRDWFETNGVEWTHGTLLLERRCGVTLLCMLDKPNRGVRRQRPRSALSEQPFPWPKVAQ